MMKTRTKLLLPLMLLCIAVFALALTVSATTYKQGDILTYGSYPQTRVTDSALLAKLNAQSGSWVSYGYYIRYKQSDFMQYKDVTLDGAKYRAVKFSSYRPYFTSHSSSADYSNQDGNGYSPNTVYWFKYEPVKWRVLDASDGENLLVVSESILDAQAFRNTDYYGYPDYYTDSTKTYYANNYAQSDIRAWLNGDFYNTTFSADEKSHIHTTTITNEAGFGYSQYNAASTQDKVFLLSYKEVLNADYGFSASTESSSTRYARGSDYAKAQGLGVSSSGGYAGNSWWRLRSGARSSCRACFVYDDGGVYFDNVHTASFGVRPAFKFNPTSSNPIEACEHSWKVTATQAANCTTPGSKMLACTKCGETKTEVIPKNNDHDYSTTWTIDTAATCGAPGSKSHHCTRCGAKADITALPATGAHTYVDGACKDCGKVKPPYTPGVVTGEGEEPAKKDLLRLQKYLAGWDVEINEAAADCNGDGKVTKMDLLRLQKYLAGWDVKLGE